MIDAFHEESQSLLTGGGGDGVSSHTIQNERIARRAFELRPHLVSVIVFIQLRSIMGLIIVMRRPWSIVQNRHFAP
jgi:hypothetical protein